MTAGNIGYKFANSYIEPRKQTAFPKKVEANHMPVILYRDLHLKENRAFMYIMWYKVISKIQEVKTEAVCTYSFHFVRLCV